MYFKNFEGWFPVKKCIHEDQGPAFIRVGEIRWAALGVNVGSEIDGKGISFARPVVIIHVISTYLALVIPLSTKVKDRAGYVEFYLHDTVVSLCIHQMKVVSQKRLLARIGKISSRRVFQIKQHIREFFSF